ncbi:hypothetical protein CRE_22143 [Caenorhabditis remanei]|uniref:Uncharacterized protein n=1 Tax=Caenorhabditis remanei TaxID=31234 RepID=E3NIZ6_CAERE|nr:hypothetical protein CRE_22143 [Caenorhabditis remanei]
MRSPNYQAPEGRELPSFFQSARKPLNRDDLDIVKEMFKKFSEEEKKTMKKTCKAYLAYYEDDRNIKSTGGYEVCCRIVEICSLKDIPSSGSQLVEPFYMQTWFFVTCGGVLLILIVGVVVGVFIYCRRKRKRSGDNGGGGQSAKGKEAGGKKNKK